MRLNGRVFNPGEMRERVTLERPALTEDAGGFDAPGVVAVATVWARWQNVHGSEVWQAEAVQAVQPVTVMLRYRPDINLTWTILHNSQRYKIVSMDNVMERDEYIELKVERQVTT